MHRTARAAAGAASLAGLLAAGTAARAQEMRPAGAPLSPSERVVQDYEPVGGRIGSFFLYPRFETRLEYDDNVLALPDDGAGDFELTLRGSALLRSDWRRHSLEVEGFVQQNYHERFKTEDTLQGGARLRGRLDVDRETSARLVASFDALAEDRANITSAAEAREPTRFRRTDILVSAAHEFGRAQLIGDAQLVVLDFSNATLAGGGVLDQEFRNSVYWRGSLEGLIELSPRFSGLVRGQIDRLSYTNNEGIGFDRDTTGYALEAGARVELSNLLFGDLRAGVLHRDSDDPTGRGVTGVSFAANLTWNVTPLTTLKLVANRQVEEGGSQLVSGNIRSQARIEAEHELLRNVVLEARAGFAQIQTVGQIDTTAEEYTLLAGATWKLNRNLRLFARADRFQRFADNTFFREFTRNRATAGVRLVF